jgi:formylglycine-generating enzyme required for sulfatase activity
MRLGLLTSGVADKWRRAAITAVLAGFCQLAPAQVSDGRGLTPLEGVLPITDDRALWDAVKDTRNAGELKVYLAQFPQGLFAALATLRVRTLEQASAPPPKAAPQTPTIAQQQNIIPGQIIKDCDGCLEMVVIPSGSFDMGSDESPSEQPVHRVNVLSFLLGKTEITQGQWNAVMGGNPSRFTQCGEDCPVENVSWYEAQEFARRLSQKTGKTYRLPSEAEWEYAARAGSNTKWSFGDNENQLSNYGWYLSNSKAWFGENKSQRVAEKKPNAFGLFDMHGNVSEWVQDCWHDNYIGAPKDGSAWTTACSSNARMLRGGSWISIPSYLRSAGRQGLTPDGRIYDFGLRLARSP